MASGNLPFQKRENVTALTAVRVKNAARGLTSNPIVAGDVRKQRSTFL